MNFSQLIIHFLDLNHLITKELGSTEFSESYRTDEGHKNSEI